MSRATDILGQFARNTVSAPTPTQKVLPQERLTPEQIYRIAAARNADTGASLPNGPEADLRNMSLRDLYNTYGAAGASDLIGQYAASSNKFLQDRTAYRSTAGAVGDMALEAGKGLFDSIGGLVSLGTGLFSDGAGAWVAEKTADGSQWLTDQKTAGSIARHRANAVINELNSADNRVRYEAERRTDGDIVAGLRRVGRDALDAVSTAVDDPTVLSDGVANAVGSLLAAGPEAKLATAAGKSILRAGMEIGAVSRGAARTALRIGDKAKMPAVIGSQEAAGVYQQTVNQVMQETGDPELANAAGLRAAAMQFPVAAAAGTLVGKFEANPFRLGSVGKTASNMLKEAVEEGAQSGSGQLSQNLAIRDLVNPNQDILDGVGEQAGIGALYGFGSTGVTQAPNVAIQSTVGAGKATAGAAIAGAKAVAKPFMDRLDQIQTEREASAPVSTQNLAPVAAEAAASVPEVKAQVEQDIADNKVPEDQAQVIRTRLDNLTQTIQFDPTELDQHPLLPQEVKDEIAKATDRFDALRKAAQIAGSTELSPNDRIPAAIYINDTLSNVGAKMVEDMNSALDPLPDDHPAVAKLRKYEDVLLALEQNPEINQARQAALQFVRQIKPQTVSEDQISTPKGQQAVQGLVSVAQSNPEEINPDVANLVLEHARSGKIKMDSYAVRALTNAAVLAYTKKDYDQQVSKLGLKPTDIVRNEILHTDSGEDVRANSAAGFYKKIMAATKLGDTQTAASSLSDMMMFAQHMQNKVQALNESLASGTASKENTTPYKALTISRKWINAPKGLWLNPTHTGSIKVAQQIGLEAKALGDMANNLAQSMPELGIAPIQLTELDPSMNAPAQQVRKKYENGFRHPAWVQKPAPASVVDRQINTTPVVDAQTQSTINKSEPVSVPEQSDGASQANATQPETTSTDTTPEPTPAPTFQTEVKQEAVPEVTKVEEQQAQPEATKAEVTTEQADVQVQDQTENQTNPEPKTLGDRHPNLIGQNGGPVTNRFVQAFKLASKITSRIGEVERPISALFNALKSKEAMAEFLGEKPRKKISDEAAKAYRDYLKTAQGIREGMITNLEKFLASEYKKGQTMADALLSGSQEVADMVRGKALNIVENVDGKLVYNEQLLQSAILAGMQWLAGSSETGREFDAEDVAQITGLDESEAENYLSFFNDGIHLLEAKRSIADKIVQYWGVSANNNVPEGFVRGIPESLAAEFIRALENASLASISEPEKINGKTFLQLNLSEEFRNSDQFKLLKSFPDTIENMVRVEPEDVRYIGEAPTDVATNQLHGSPVQLQSQQREAIETAQKTPYKINKHMLRFYNLLGREGLLALLGKGDHTAPNLNVNHAASIEGYNRTLESAFDGIGSLVTEMQAQADDITQLPVFFKYGVTSVGRLQMLGRTNPQSSKLVREVLLPTWSKLNLSDTEGKDYRSFMVAVAQHLGEKVHKQKASTSVAKAEKLLTGKLAPVVDLFREMLADDTITGLDQAEIDQVKQALGKELSPGSIHAVMEFARFLNETEEGRASFETALYLEADGVTDGPVNSLVNLTSGTFTPDWIDRVRRGGLFMVPVESLGDYIENTKDTADLYEKTTQILNRVLAESSAKNAHLSGLNDALKHLLVTFLDDANLGKNDVLDLKRGIAKNPLTVTVYGSGVKGIADKLTKQIIDKLYESLSEGEMTDRTRKALAALSSVRISLDKGELVAQRDGSVDLNAGKGSQFTLTKSMTANLQNNVMHLFAKPLVTSINEMMGGAIETAKLVRTATQVQAIHLKYAFKQAVADALENLPEGRQAKDFLTKQELDKILKDLTKTHPMIDTGTQLVFVGGSAKADVETSEFGRALDGNLRTDGFTWGPKNPGVAGIPYLVIATGDGQMILNALTGEEAPQGTLPVFDGINMKLDQIGQDSQTINKAVFDGWMKNPVRSLADSFSTFVGSNGPQFEIISTEMMDEMVKAFGDDLGQDITADIQALSQNLEQTARELDARKAVLARINMTIDHMAGASAPFVSEGEILPADPIEAAQRLNEMLQEELAKTEKPKAEPAKETVDLQNLGSEAEGGARIIGRDELRAVADQLDIPAGHKSLVKDAVRALTTKGWNIVVGTSEQIARFIQDNGLNVNLAGANGAALFGSKTILMNTPGSETLAHELVHAATLEKVYAFLSGGTVSQQDAEAIGRIQKLMDQFRGLDLKGADAETVRAYRDAITAMDDALSANEGVLGKAAELNEFMAWVLANQKLADLTSKVRVRDKLALIAKKVLGELKKLWRGGLAPSVGEDFYSNLRFNSLVLMRSDTPKLGEIGDLTELAAFHAPSFGTDDRIEKLHTSLVRKLAGLGQAVSASKNIDRVGEHHIRFFEATGIAKKVMKQFNQGNRFPMTQQQAHLFETMVAVFGTAMELNGNTTARMQQLFKHVLDNLAPEDFMRNRENPDDADVFQAQNKFNLITGNFFVGQDRDGRSTILPAFIALATVNDEFREILRKLPVPKSQIQEGRTLDAVLSNGATQALDRAFLAMSGEGQNAGNTKAAIDALVDFMAKDQAAAEAYIERFVGPAGNLTDRANDKFVSVMNEVTDKAAEKLREKSDSTENRYVKLGARAAEAMLGVFNEEIAGKASNGIMSILNKANTWNWVNDLFNEVVGRTSENAPIYDMVKQVRAFVQQTRQIYRERLPAVLKSKFSKPLSAEQWSALHQGLGKTDLAALSSLGSGKIIDLLSDAAKVKSEVSSLEATVQSLDQTHSSRILDKAQELAEYMMTGKASGNLLRNAYAVAWLPGELPNGIHKRRGKPSEDLVKAVDQLVSLYALQKLDTKTRTMVSELAAGEPGGMGFLLDYMNGQRKDELLKSHSERGMLNHYKGGIPSEVRSGASLIVARDSDHADLLARGYERMGDYRGVDLGSRNKGYYYAPLTGRSPFSQGIAQNIRATLFGVDPVTGFSFDMHNAGRITDQQAVRSISLKANGRATSPLLPVYDGDGQIVAFERSIDPAQRARLEQETDLANVLGMWRGRQIEEATAHQFNQKLVERLHDIWTGREKSRTDEYVDLFTSDDPVHQDAVSLFTPQMKAMIKDTFGAEGFMVRKDMINDAIGYRSASIGDHWTGNTRIDPKTSAVAVKVAEAVMGKNAYKMLVTGEKLWQNFVSDARTTIVVRSVIVPVSNMISNVYQLASRGVPLADILRGMSRKTTEIHSYHQNHIREVELDAELRSVGETSARGRAIQAQLRIIRDSYRRLSIWPLIERGELSSVSEATVEREETTMFEGKLTDYMEKLAGKLPESVRTAGRYAVISRDTALFQGLQRAVEYGDFLAKAVLYDDLVKRKGMTQDQAMARITEEFINFDRLPGRSRSYLENMGLIWFWHFKLRSIKVALSTLRNNPVHMLMAGLAPRPEFFGSVGLPIEDNAISKVFDGSIGYSMGPMQGFHAHNLNPWVNLFH